MLDNNDNDDNDCEDTSTVTSSPLKSQLHQCLVCYSDLKHPAKTSCGHNDICGICHLRLRHLHADKACPMCKHVNEQLIVDGFDTNKPFDEYPLWGDELGGDFIYQQNVGMFFERNYYEQDIAPLFGYRCGSCTDFDGSIAIPDEEPSATSVATNPLKKNTKKAIPPLRNLQDHLRIKHRQTLCQLCVDFKRDFVASLPRFTPTQLKHHQQQGDGSSSGFSGHPLCEFCRPKRFYDLSQLYLHLQKDHYKCHVCEQQGLANQYFRNYTTLERHFDQQHFLCKDTQCVAARFMVFQNELDLRHHTINVHGGNGASTKIQLEFRVRREGYDGAGYANPQSLPSEQDFGFGLDGQAFVPESLPQPREPTEESSHPAHLQRTAELRAQAQEIRLQLEQEVDAFPTLSDSTQQQPTLRMGWNSTGVTTRVAKMPGIQSQNKEQFPALPVTTMTRNKIKNGTAVSALSSNRQFATMAIAGNSTNGITNWNQTATMTTPATRPASASYVTPAATAAAFATSASNLQANLASENFPSLGGPSRAGPKPYQSVQQVEAHRQAPAMNELNFPPPLSSTLKNSVQQNVLRDPKVTPKPPPMNHMNFPPPPSGMSLSAGLVTLDKMKAKLGSIKYKELKNLTKEFVVEAIAPDAYVDHAASLFENGYGDSDFWTFVPSLLMTCPNESNANQAIRYMEHLRASSQISIAKGPALTNWSPPTAVMAAPTNKTYPEVTSWQGRPTKPAAMLPAVSFPPVARNSTAAQGMKQTAWSSGGASTTLLVGSGKGSVAVAAMNQGASIGTATKAMAKEQKQVKQAAQKQQEANKDGKAKKKKNELRDLAFGRK